MKILKTVGVKELKNNLSRYLGDVKSGVRIFVTDRNIVIAEMHEPFAKPYHFSKVEQTLSMWIESGVVISPAQPKRKYSKTNLQVKDGTSLRVLNEDRGE